MAVAALKRVLRGFPSITWHSSPRPHGRGRIEAAVEVAGSTLAENVLHGLMAVAALKRETSAILAHRRQKFSTASWPWPH